MKTRKLKTQKMKPRNKQKGGELAYILGASAIGALILLGASQLSRKKGKTNILRQAYNGRIIENLYPLDVNLLPLNNQNNVVSENRVNSIQEGSPATLRLSPSTRNTTSNRNATSTRNATSIRNTTLG